MKLNIYRLRGHFKGVLFVMAILGIIGLVWHSHYIVEALRKESRGILEFYARLYAEAASTESESSLNFIFDEIILRTDYPIILTDAEGTPVAWQGIDIDASDRSETAMRRVEELVEIMAREARPIPLMYQDIPLGRLYYGDSRLIKQLQRLPYIGISVVGLFILIGFWGFRTIQRSEQQFIWVGLSKETAHQIGTPLSSIMGWHELLASRAQDGKMREILQEMEKDIERLNKVTARFSQIGSTPDLKRVPLRLIVEDVAAYFRRRLPQWGKRVDISLDFRIEPVLPLNRDLFEWVIENLVKNALDAIEGDRGEIAIKVDELKNGKEQCFIDITDDGRGIDAARKKDVFKPGFSTKKRGWGLGLSLAKRIIEEYHGGKLVIKDTKLNQGTTMRMILSKR